MSHHPGEDVARRTLANSSWAGRLLGLILLASIPLQARAQDSSSELDLFKLEEEVRQTVTSITKTKQDLREAPASVSVVTKADIRSRGYRSIAEVLRDTVGLHMIDDLVAPDFGIRGVHGGVTGMSRLLKVMIDGQSVQFRPTTGYALGPEFLPIELIERVEIIRGPVSALYGANAFLGVVNVITRAAGDVEGIGVTARGGVMQSSKDLRPSGAATVWGGSKAGVLDVLGGVSVGVFDRAGLRLPESSPNFSQYSDPVSAKDRSSPRSAYGRVGISGGDLGDFTLSGGVQRTESDQLWVDTDVSPGRNLALTETHVGIENRYLRLEWDKRLSDFELIGSTSYSEGDVTPTDRIDVGDPLFDRARELSYRAFGLVAEGRYQSSRAFAVVGGLDFDLELEEPQRRYSLYKQDSGSFHAGDLRLLQDPGEARTFTNFAGYGQVIYYPWESIGLTGGFRFDHHSLYGLVPSGRLGLVWLFGTGGYVKTLLGTSFKAPSDDQLFSQPLYEGALAGNARLEAQRATTGELVVGWDVGGRQSASVTLFYTTIARKVEFVPTGNGLRAENVAELGTVGLEAEAKWSWQSLGGFLDLGVFGNATWIIAARKETGVVVATVGDEPFPTILGTLGIDLTVPEWHLRLLTTLNAASQAHATGANVLLNGSQGYELDGYALLGINLSTVGLTPFGERELVLSLRGTNVLDIRFAQPGTGGVDIPGLRRAYFFTASQEF